MEKIDKSEVERARAGRDSYSGMRLPELMELRPEEYRKIAKVVSDPKEQAVALRWVLRGRSVAWAIMKVEVAREAKEHFRAGDELSPVVREIIGY